MIYYYEGCAITAPLTIESNYPLFVNEAVNLKQTRVGQDAQRWEVTFSIMVTSGEDDIFVNTVSNWDSTRKMVMPQLRSVMKNITVTSELTTAATTTVGDTSVFVNTSYMGQVLPKGSFISFGNHDKLYMTTSKVTFDGSGVAEVNIFPAIQVAAVNDTVVNHPSSANPTELTFYSDITNINGITYTDGVLTSMDNIKVIEAI